MDRRRSLGDGSTPAPPTCLPPEPLDFQGRLFSDQANSSPMSIFPLTRLDFPAYVRRSTGGSILLRSVRVVRKPAESRSNAGARSPFRGARAADAINFGYPHEKCSKTTNAVAVSARAPHSNVEPVKFIVQSGCSLIRFQIHAVATVINMPIYGYIRSSKGFSHG